MPVCCVVSGGGLSGGLITRPEEYYRLWCDRESWIMRGPSPNMAVLAM
jgi:hypothetical protein